MCRGELVEIGGGFRVPEVMAQSGARLVEVGTTNRTRLADYERALAARRRRRARAEGAPVELPHRRASPRHAPTRRARRARRAGRGRHRLRPARRRLPVAARRVRRRGCAGEPAARQTLAAGAALVTFSGDKLLGGPQAGIIAGRADLVGACAAHPLARALRPGGLVLGALQERRARLPPPRRRRPIPFWRMATARRWRACRPRAEADRRRAAGRRSSTAGVAARWRHPARASTIPSAGVALDGRPPRRAARGDRRRSSPGSEDGRTILDLRTVEPGRRRRASRARRSPALADLRRRARRRHRRPRRPRQVVARARPHRHRPRPVGGGEAARPHHRPRLRATTLPSGEAISLRRRARPRPLPEATCSPASAAVDACLFVVAATEGWKPQSEEHLRILELARHPPRGRRAHQGRPRRRRPASSWPASTSIEHVAGTFLERRADRAGRRPTGVGLDELRAALDALVRPTPAAADRGRPRLWVDRVFAAKGAGTVVTGTLTGGPLPSTTSSSLRPGRGRVRVRGLQIARPGRRRRSGRATAWRVNLAGVEHTTVGRGDVLVQPGRLVAPTRARRRLARRARRARPRGVAARRVRRLPRLGRAPGPGAGARRPRPSRPGSRGFVRLHLPDAAAAAARGPLRAARVGPPGDRRRRRGARRRARSCPRPRPGPTGRSTGWSPSGAGSRADGARSCSPVSGAPRSVGPWVVAPGAVAALVASLEAQVARGRPARPRRRRPRRPRACRRSRWSTAVEVSRRVACGPSRHPTRSPTTRSWRRWRRAAFAPPEPPDGVDRAELRELVRRGLVVERDGVYFAPAAIEAGGPARRRACSRATPTASPWPSFRDAAGITRKHALPLLAELDARGVTRRRGDLRIAGPRLPRP